MRTLLLLVAILVSNVAFADSDYVDICKEARDFAGCMEYFTKESQVITPDEEILLAEYTDIIRSVIGENWIIPPGRVSLSASAVVKVIIDPSGELVSSRIVYSSGLAAFDRSIIEAVERAERIPELQDLETEFFERNFRTIELVFGPVGH